MAQTRGQWAELYDSVEKTVNGVMFAQLKERPAIYRRYYNVKNSNRKFERIHTVTAFGDVPEKGEGALYTTDLLQAGYTKDFTHTEFGLGFEYTETAMEDDQENQLTQGAKWLAFSARYVQEKRAAAPFNNGFGSETTPDGVSFFNTAHVLKGGGTARNRLATDADLSVNSLTDILSDMQTETKIESGQLVDVIDGLVLLVHPSNEMLAYTILESKGASGTADNDTNALRARRSWTMIVNPHLTDTDAFFVGASNKNMHGLCTYERTGIQAKPVREDPKTGNLIIKVRFRQSWGAWMWQGWYGTSGA